MYDALTGTYAFSCPHGTAARVRLSGFRVIERLPGAAHPAVYGVRYACPCGEQHTGLVSHDELDWAPLGLGERGTFRNLMTSLDDPLGRELGDVAATRIGAGEWPWSFFCLLEDRTRPVTPSAFSVIAPEGGSVGIAVRCPVCAAVSVNLVTRAHVDVPFWNDARVGVIEHVYEDDAARLIDEFRAELASARFDERRLHLEP